MIAKSITYFSVRVEIELEENSKDVYGGKQILRFNVQAPDEAWTKTWIKRYFVSFPLTVRKITILSIEKNQLILDGIVNVNRGEKR